LRIVAFEVIKSVVYPVRQVNDFAVKSGLPLRVSPGLVDSYIEALIGTHAETIALIAQRVDVGP
jgi:hypothetical protein